MLINLERRAGYFIIVLFVSHIKGVCGILLNK